jgi:hypothetical protein
MDIVEFAEKTYGAELYEWQKNYLRTLDQLYRECEDGKCEKCVLVMHKGVGRMFTYFKMKELLSDGAKNVIE